MKNSKSYEKLLIEELNSLRLHVLKNQDNISSIEQEIESLKNNQNNVHTFAKVIGSQKTRDSTITNTAPRDYLGDIIRCGDEVEWVNKSKFDSTGGIVTKLSKTTVTSIDRKRKITTWRKHKNCIVKRSSWESKKKITKER